MGIWIAFILLAAVALCAHVAHQQRAKGAFARQLRMEFPEYADELTDTYAKTMFDYIEEGTARKQELEKKIKTLKRKARSRSDDGLLLLERTLAGFDKDAFEQLVKMSPPKFARYLSSTDETEFGPRFNRVISGVSLVANS